MFKHFLFFFIKDEQHKIALLTILEAIELIYIKASYCRIVTFITMMSGVELVGLQPLMFL